MGNDTIRESLKNDRLRQVQLSAAEALITQATRDGMKVQAVFAEERIELEFSQCNGKTLRIHVSYEDFASRGYRLFQLVETLGKRNR